MLKISNFMKVIKKYKVLIGFIILFALILHNSYRIYEESKSRKEKIKTMWEAMNLLQQLTEIRTKRLTQAQVDEAKEERAKYLLQRKKKWRQLQIGMTSEQVHYILGSPENVRSTDFAFLGVALYWSFEDGGHLRFKNNRLESWEEPR